MIARCTQALLLLLIVPLLGAFPAQATEQVPDENAPVVLGEDAPLTPIDGDEIVHSWALTPAGANNETGASSRPTLSYSADPGSVIEDAVTVFNLGNEQLTFRVYATDAFNTETGEFGLLPGGDDPVDVGTWVTLAQENLTVPPGMAVTVPITITIPEGATPGDHVGAVLASSEALSTNESGNAVVLDRRTGTRLYLRVNGPLRQEPAIEGLSVAYHPRANPLDGGSTVRYEIHNRGNVRTSGLAAVSVAGPLGIGRQQAGTAEFPELLPGQSMVMEVELNGVPALLVASAKIELEPDPEEADMTFSPVSRSSTTFALPVSIFFLLMFLLFALLATRAYRRHSEPGVHGHVGGKKAFRSGPSEPDREAEPQLT